MFVEQIITGKWRQNCYIVHQKNSDALVIDPGSDVDEITAVIEEKGLTPLAILNTHAHYDHIGAAAAIKKKYKVPFYLHKKDTKLLKYANLYRKAFDGDGAVEIPEIEILVDQVDHPLRIGDFAVDVIFTPGHTPGGVCYQIGDSLFTGDTLFIKAVGRVDLPGGNMELLRESLRDLRQISSDMKLYPGHGKPGTMADVLAMNEQFVEFVDRVL